MAIGSQVMRARLHVIQMLHSGALSPGSAISVKETAAVLRLSHTPVREALARLVGEGAVVAAGHGGGVAVSRYTAASLSEVMALAGVLLDAAVEMGKAVGPVPSPPIGVQGDDAVSVIEAAISSLIAGCDNGQICRAIGRVGLILAPYAHGRSGRRLERAQRATCRRRQSLP